MSLYITEFRTIGERAVVRRGEPFQVRLEAVCIPPGGADEEEITFSCEPAGFSVKPGKRTMRITAEDDSVACMFQLTIEGPRADKVDVYAVSSQNKDAIFVKVEI